MAQVQQSGIPVNLSVSGAISKGPCSLIGFYVNSITAGATLVMKNGGASGTAINGAITLIQGWNTYPAYFTSSSGAYATISGTVDITFIVGQG